MNHQRIGDAAEALLNFVESNSTFQTDKVMTVPAALFTDPDQRRAEIDLIFKRVPLMLALSCEVPRPGDYKAMQVVGLPVLIVRDKACTVRAFLNACAHRWAPVAPEGLGSCSHFRFVCPFHGWTYGADGKLLGISDRAKFGEIDRSTHGLKDLPCEERHGMIFVCLTPDTVLDLDGYCGTLLEECADAGLKDWVLAGTNTLEGANWKIHLTNFLESYHFATAHPQSVATYFASNVNHYEGFGPNMRIGFAEHSIGKLHEVARELWGNQETRGFMFMRYFFPNAILSLFSSDIATLIQTFPGPTPESSRIVMSSMRREWPIQGVERLKLKEEIDHNSELLRDEDVVIGIRTQKGLESGAHTGLLYGRNERGNQYFHEWLDWYCRDDSSLPKPRM